MKMNSNRRLDVLFAKVVLRWDNVAISDWDLDAGDPLDWGGIPPGETHVHRVPFYTAHIPEETCMVAIQAVRSLPDPPSFQEHEDDPESSIYDSPVLAGVSI
jgi:hypothetical protein